MVTACFSGVLVSFIRLQSVGKEKFLGLHVVRLMNFAFLWFNDYVVGMGNGDKPPSFDVVKFH